MPKIGIIGCGRIAEEHIKIYKSIQGTEVIGVSDINSDRLTSFANKFHIPRSFTDYLGLLSLKDLDFVDICTPPSIHPKIVCDAAEYGRHILVEKPMALSVSECEKMQHAVEKGNVSFCVCHNQIFFPAMKKAKELVDSGQYNLISFRTSVRENPTMYHVPAWNTSQEENGIIWEVGCHPAYLQLHFLENISEVYAVGRKAKYPVFDEFAVLLKGSGQAFGIVEVSWLSKETEKIYELNCSNGKRAFMISSPPWASQGYETLFERTGLAEDSLNGDIKKLLGHVRRKSNPFGYHIGHFHLISNFIESIRVGSTPPVTAEKGTTTVRLLECIKESLVTGKAIKMK